MTDSDRTTTRPVRADAIARPHPSRLDPAQAGYAEALAAHTRAIEAGDAGYMDPITGLFAMTARHLLDRGWCCDRGCRHCPWIGAEPADPTITEEHQ
ncbi:MAG: DUF5522 domain-containing protein [Actinomycetota bacterium]